MEEEIKRLRVKIDGLAQLTKELKPPKFTDRELESMGKPKGWADSNTKQIEKAVDSLYLAKAWLGKVLEALGTENPYKSRYKTKEDIEPTADKANFISTNTVIGTVIDGVYVTYNNEKTYSNKNHIEKVDWLRTEISFISSYETGSIFYFNEEMYPNANRYFNNYMDYMSEARFWLGFELERIKNN
jgi:hypothetical protein